MFNPRLVLVLGDYWSYQPVCELHLLILLRHQLYFCFPGPWTSLWLSLTVPTVLVPHEGPSWGTQASVFPDLQVQATSSFPGKDDKHVHSCCPRCKDANPGEWGLPTQHLVLSHHHIHNRRWSGAPLTPHLCSLRISLPPFFHLLKLHRSRPPGLSLALNLSLLPPLRQLCLVTSKSLWRGSAHSATLLVVFWWDWKAFQSGLRCEGIFPSTHLCSSAGHGFHHACVRCWGGGCSHHCGLILIILPYGGWLPHNHP